MKNTAIESLRLHSAQWVRFCSWWWYWKIASSQRDS